MKLVFPKGTTNRIVPVFIQNNSVTTGAGLGALSNSSGIVGGYLREGATGVALAVDEVVSTPGTYQAPSAPGKVRIGTPANMRPGVYELHFHNNLWATGAEAVVISLGGATNMADIGLEVQLSDPVRGLGAPTAIPNAAAGAAGGLPTVDANNRIAGIAGTINTLDGLDTAQDAQHTITQGRLPAALVGGRMDSSIGAMAANVLTATAINDGAFTGAKFVDGFFTAAKYAANAITNLVIADGALTPVKAAAGFFDAVWSVTNRILTAGTNIVLAKGTGITGLNDLSAAQVNAEADTALADAGVTTVRMARLDADVSSRLAAVSYAAPDNVGIAAAAAAAASAAGTASTINGKIGTPAVSIAADIATRATPAQVNAEVVDALAVDTYPEPGLGTPPATASLATKIGYSYKGQRNKKEQTETEFRLFGDDGITVHHKAPVTDAAGVTTIGELAAGL